MKNLNVSKHIWLCMASLVFLLSSSPSFAQSSAPNKAPNQLSSQDPSKDQIYGWQVMTDTEREMYKKQLAALKNTTERDVFLQDHRTRMSARAREKGITLKEPTSTMSPTASGTVSNTMTHPNDATKSPHNNATAIRPGTGSGPYKDK